jgi:SAM-dependent methyltransferase
LVQDYLTKNDMIWKYILIGLLRRYVPKSVLFAIMERRGDSSIEERCPNICLKMWTEQLSRRGLGFADKHVLEVGSGRYARFALQMLAAGAKRVTLIDLYAIPLTEPAHHSILLKDCLALGLNEGDAFSRIETVRADITRIPPPSPNKQVDLAISHSVLEHVKSPSDVLASCFHWLKPGGITHHIIDLRDHSLRFQYPFEMLTFSDQVWSRWLDLGGGFHLNRWRLPDYLRAAHDSCFVDVNYDILLKDEDTLKPILPRLDFRFRSIPEEMLAILSVSLYAQKPILGLTG